MAEWFSGLKKYFRDVSEEGQKILSGQVALEANKVINTQGEMLAAVAKQSHKTVLNRRMDAMNAAREARGEKALFEMDEATEEYSNIQRAKSLFYNSQGKLAKGRIAGVGLAGYSGISAAGRIASGGGLYRDSDGNFDIIGVPIV